MGVYRTLRIDPRCITAESITFAAGTVTINVPQRTFYAGCPYFLRITEEVPEDATVNAPVVLTIGTGTVEYPLMKVCGGQVIAADLRSGYSYPITLVQGGTNGAFKLLDRLPCTPVSAVATADGTAPAVGGGGA